MRLFLTGASGLVGSNILPVALRRGHEVIAVRGSWQGEIPGATQVIQVDLSDPHAVQSSILEAFPDAIINAAGVTEPFLCDRDPKGSASINVDLPKILARIAHHLSARLVHLSSEQIFDGNSAPYERDHTPSPSNLYGHQKAESEQRVHSGAPEHAVTLRLPLLNGNSPGGTRSLHERLFGLWASGQPARLFRDEIRQPCGADNAAEVVIEMCERPDLTGIFNWAGSEALSRLEMGRRILDRFGLPDDLVIGLAQREIPGGKDRPPDLSLDLAGLAGKLKTPLQDFATQLENLIVPRPFREWYHKQE
ncbi:MAG: SDR family NAD(P)-dependent oxidoreductase [Verrucomicrobia bacterium]|nr:MAG: SDR family NAD(P)-dependent oxidoreductase [Verrucomicrobiota bacterium]